MPIEYRVIGRNIRAARKRMKMTQEAVAEAIEMSGAHYGKVERDERPVNLARLAQLCVLLDTPLEVLVEGAVVTEDGIALALTRPADDSAFLHEIQTIAKGCTSGALRLMLRLCADVAEEDKAGNATL